MQLSPNIRFMTAALLLVIIDQISKVIVKGFNLFGIEHVGMELGESFPVIDSFFWITFVENPGMAFGLEFGEAKIFLSLFSIIASVLLGWYLWRTPIDSLWTKLGLMLVLAGATGNLIDRVFYGWFYDYAPLFYGKVVDFAEVEFFDFSLFGKRFTTWPVFNVADSCVSIGMVLLIFNSKHLPFLHEDEKAKTPDSAADLPGSSADSVSSNNSDSSAIDQSGLPAGTGATPDGGLPAAGAPDNTSHLSTDAQDGQSPRQSQGDQ